MEPECEDVTSCDGCGYEEVGLEVENYPDQLYPPQSGERINLCKFCEVTTSSQRRTSEARILANMMHVLLGEIKVLLNQTKEQG